MRTPFRFLSVADLGSGPCLHKPLLKTSKSLGRGHWAHSHILLGRRGETGEVEALRGTGICVVHTGDRSRVRVPISRHMVSCVRVTNWVIHTVTPIL